MAEFYRKKKKVCYMCTGKDIDYKDVEILRKYINDKGKILPRRVTGACAKHQRHIARQVKRARAIALLPFTNSSKASFMMRNATSTFFASVALI